MRGESESNSCTFGPPCEHSPETVICFGGNKPLWPDLTSLRHKRHFDAYGRRDDAFWTVECQALRRSRGKSGQVRIVAEVLFCNRRLYSVNATCSCKVR